MEHEEALARVAALLRELRQERGVSMRQLGDDAGVDHAQVSRAERGRDARFSTWAKLFAALGYRLELDVNELCEEAGDLLSEEAERRRERRLEGLCTGRRRFWR